jgi:hypothetical protein
MKIERFLQMICAVFLTVGFSALAQNQLVITLNGSCATLDSDGHIVSKPINNKTLLRDFAQTHGFGTNVSRFALAYHLGGDQLGDTIEVINWTNGSVVFTLFGFFYGEDFGRTFLISSSGQQLRRIEYIYTSQNSHSVGTASLTDYYVLDGNGNTNTTYVQGHMQYLIQPDATHTNTQVCTVNFNTMRPWQFSH